MTTFETNPPEAAEASLPLVEGFDDAASEVAPTTMSKKRKGFVAALLAALVILALLFVWYLMNRKPLTELPGLGGAALPHYERSIYGAIKPLGVAVTDSGDRVYVTESGGAREVKVYDGTGKAVGSLKPPTSTGAAHLPMYVAINPTSQDVYVSDRLTASIYVYDAKGTYLRTFAPKGSLSGKFAPLALAFSPDGSLYVTDVGGATTKTHRVVVFGPDGTLARTMGAPDLNFPNGIAVDSNDDILVADSNNGRLVIFGQYGKVLASINPGIGEGDLGMPRGVAVDDSGKLLVVDTADHAVRTYSLDKSTPTYLASFGVEGQLDGTFEYPNGVTTDKRAHVYVTDRENNRVQVWGY